MTYEEREEYYRNKVEALMQKDPATIAVVNAMRNYRGRNWTTIAHCFKGLLQQHGIVVED